MGTRPAGLALSRGVCTTPMTTPPPRTHRATTTVITPHTRAHAVTPSRRHHHRHTTTSTHTHSINAPACDCAIAHQDGRCYWRLPAPTPMMRRPLPLAHAASASMATLLPESAPMPKSLSKMTMTSSDTVSCCLYSLLGAKYGSNGPWSGSTGSVL